MSRRAVKYVIWGVGVAFLAASILLALYGCATAPIQMTEQEKRQARIELECKALARTAHPGGGLDAILNHIEYKRCLAAEGVK